MSSVESSRHNEAGAGGRGGPDLLCGLRPARRYRRILRHGGWGGGGRGGGYRCGVPVVPIAFRRSPPQAGSSKIGSC